MISIVLSCSEETKAKLLAAGFKEQTVLVRNKPVMSSEENKSREEHELFKLAPFQFLVSDFWGMGAN